MSTKTRKTKPFEQVTALEVTKAARSLSDWLKANVSKEAAEAFDAFHFLTIFEKSGVTDQGQASVRQCRRKLAAFQGE